LKLVGLSAKGRPVGEYRANRKLSYEQAMQIRKLRADTGMGYKKLGALFGVSRQNAWYICKGKIWNLEPVRFAYQATPEELEQVAHYAAEGLGHYSIAKRMGVTRMSAYRMLQEVRSAQDHRGK